MKKCNTLKGSVAEIESMGLVDGPGIRTVIFLNGCTLRCKYCHNPEMWHKNTQNITPNELVKKIIRYKPYYKNDGGVTFSGGEPLLQPEFLKESCRLLKQENIHIALDTAGVGLGNYDEILKYIDLVLLDIKHTNKTKYKELTGKEINQVEEFIKSINKNKKKVWIRQVIIPKLTDSEEYINSLITYLKKIKHIERVDFLPYHKLGKEKYLTLNIEYPYENLTEMDKDQCQKLYTQFIEKYNKSSNLKLS